MALLFILLIISSPEPLGLQCELVVYPSSRRPSVVHRHPPFSKIFSFETTWPIKAKFYAEPPWEGGTKVCTKGPGHMTKMAAMPIYGKNLQISSTPEPISTKRGMYTREFLPIIVCTNDDPGVNLTYFTKQWIFQIVLHPLT